MEPLYSRVPERLRGYVELVYDLNNQPSFGLIEPLLYRSPYYEPSAQSLMLSLISQSGELQDPSLKLLLRQIGFTNVYKMSEMETVQLAGAEITGLPFLGEHADLDIRSKLAYVCRLGQRSLLFAADSCNIEPRLYERLQEACLARGGHE